MDRIRIWRYGKVDNNVDEVELTDIPARHSYLERHADIDVTNARNPHHGWRKVVILAALIAFIVLVVNLIFTTVTIPKFQTSKGVGNIYQGDCALVGRWNAAIHFLVNILSTALLGASNYTMQCLNSPTRSDVDKAHSNGNSLDIGLPSVKNFCYLPYWKGLIWLALCLSTLPLHFFWNSTIFTTIVEFDVGVVTVDESFFYTTGLMRPNYTQCLDNHEQSSELASFIFDNYDLEHYTKITNFSCSGMFPTVVSQLPSSRTYRNIIVVQNQIDPLNLTGIQCNYAAQPDSINWNITSNCYIENKGLPGCTLHYSSYLLHVVITCNTVKVICMVATASLLWNDGGSILATVGDAAASFIECPDKTTKNRCVADNARSALETASSEFKTTTYTRRSSVRMIKVAKVQWIISVVLCTVYVILGVATYPLNENSLIEQLNSLSSFASDGMGFIRLIMVANTPQIILSFTYFSYNTLVSAQCAASEWAEYTDEMKVLRVTWPRGDQRSTYWLSVPFRYGALLSIGLLLMHFFQSQTIDISRIKTFDKMGNVVGGDVAAAIMFNSEYLFGMCVIILILLEWQILWGSRPFNNCIPYHKNSSAVISALCHMSDPYEQGRQYSQGQLRDAAARPLTWGVTRMPARCGDGVSDYEEVPGHCGFSLEPVPKPKNGLRYE